MTYCTDGVKFGVERLTLLSVQGWKERDPKSENFMQFRDVKALHGHISWAILTKFVILVVSFILG